MMLFSSQNLPPTVLPWPLMFSNTDHTESPESERQRKNKKRFLIWHTHTFVIFLCRYFFKQSLNAAFAVVFCCTVYPRCQQVKGPGTLLVASITPHNVLPMLTSKPIKRRTANMTSYLCTVGESWRARAPSQSAGSNPRLSWWEVTAPTTESCTGIYVKLSLTLKCQAKFKWLCI